ncbi:MAG: sodium:solute symporter [Candidatus Dormibacteraeota bacterium]|uniref:Sodium:solute symporter n=1 Tax=Candidatus Aeolococcus gillhamiae TaxID=3127015 RepID=A0A934JUM6_9BACT|nr:sodium:solute symporter [Candidatus Dormibacteraeota bacterium]
MTHWDELIIVIAIGVLVTIIGFGASRWRKADLNHIEEWGLAGRSFGTIVTWFLLGGDLYTAYTFVAVPGVVFALGAYGLFALPYTIIVYPLVFLTMPRLWQVSRNKGYITGSDYVKDRFDSRFFALLIALTGIVATMPYIALQIFGIKLVLANIGISPEAALVIAFVVLAIFTYVSGLRAPALIAVVKDGLIWLVVIVAVIYIPYKLGGFGNIFHKVEQVTAAAPVGKGKPDVLPASLFNAYSSIALGSALALFLYPHSLTGVFSAKSQRTIKRNASFLPAYTFLLGLIGLLGFMAIAAGIKPSKAFGNNSAIADLFQKMFPSWFTGVAFAAIAVGALVPAAVMAIAAANLFSRNIWREYVHPAMSRREEATVSKVVSLLVKVGALAFVLALPTTDIINYQTAGGVWMINALPALVVALYVKRLNVWAMVAGWAGGMGLGTYALVQEKFLSSLHDFGFGGKIYIGFAAIIVNLVVVGAGSLVAAAVGQSTPGKLSEADYRVPGLGEAQRPALVQPMAPPLAGGT